MSGILHSRHHGTTCVKPTIMPQPPDPIHKLPNSSDDILKAYADVFQGIGLFPGEYKIQLHQEVEPVVHPPRRIPIALRDRLKSERDRMETEAVIVSSHPPLTAQK